MRCYRVGDIDIAVAIHGGGTGSPRWMFPDIAHHELAEAIAPYLDAEGHIEFVYSSLIVSSGGHVVLVDAGPAARPGSGPSSIVLALVQAGFRPRDVDIVVISHGHDDHVGGLTAGHATGSAVAFPNARHYVAAAEFRHWTMESGRGGPAGEKLNALNRAGALTLVDGTRELMRGISLLPTPGHTPGHLAVVLSSGDDHALYVGDALAHAVNVAQPDWNHFSDMLAEPARESRGDLVERAAAGNHLVLASHIPVAGRIRPMGGARRFTPVAASDVLSTAQS